MPCLFLACLACSLPALLALPALHALLALPTVPALHALLALLALPALPAPCLPSLPRLLLACPACLASSLLALPACRSLTPMPHHTQAGVLVTAPGSSSFEPFSARVTCEVGSGSIGSRPIADHALQRSQLAASAPQVHALPPTWDVPGTA